MKAFAAGSNSLADRSYANVGKAVLQIETAQQVAIRFDTIRIINVRRLQEAEQVALARLDDVLKTEIGIGLVADKADGLDAGLRALGNFENEVDAVVRQFDYLRHNPHVEATIAPVLLDQALRIGLHHRTRQRASYLRLNFTKQLLVLGLGVALEGDAVDHGIFDHRNDQPSASLTDLDVLE